MYILYSIIILSILVIIHELGHYFAAKWSKVKVEEFGLGYPPRALKLFQDKETEWTLNWIPFGGFVKLAGEEGSPSDKKPDEKSLSAKSSEGTREKFSGKFYQVSTFKRLVIILAGATVNFVFGIIAFTIVFSVMGIPVYEARIESVARNSPAAVAGIPANVRIEQVKDEAGITEIESTEELIAYIQDHTGQTVTLITSGECTEQTCAEDEREFTTYLRTPDETPAGEGSLGIAFQPPILKKYPWYEMPFRGAAFGVIQAVQLGVLILTSLYTVILQAFSQGQVPAELSGPVGIVQQAGQSGIFDDGILGALSFAGMLSVNLAIMNVLPVPPLDGGRALFILLEKALGKKKTERVELILNYGGYFVLLALIIFVTGRDIINLFS